MTSSYLTSIDTMSISRTVFEIFDFNVFFISIEKNITFELCFISQFKCYGLNDSFEIEWNITI